MRRGFAAVLLAAAAAAPDAATAARYHVVAVDAATDTGVSASALNRHGRVAGTANDQAVVFDHGTTTALGTLGGARSAGRGISDNGIVAGDSATAAGQVHAFSWQAGTMTDLGTLPRAENQPPLSSASAVNKAGQVTGYSAVDAWNAHAFLYAGGAMADLGVLPGGSSSFGNAINEAGHVAGYCVVGSGAASAPHAFLWRDAAMVDLHPAGDAGTSQANGVNGLDQVVGAATHPGTTPLRSTAFLWDKGTMTDLGTVAPGVSSKSWARAINDHGVIVGSSATDAANSDFVAMVVQGGTMKDLNALMDGASRQAGWHLTSAIGVNANGQIAGMGTLNGVAHAFLATPVR
jgi:probable HAF family extracellular repeat protein